MRHLVFWYKWTPFKGKSIDISVLQGSISCFISDLHTVTNLLTLLFADDTAGPKSGLNLNELIDKVNVEVNKLANWFRVNKMAVNVSKTKYIIFKPKGVTESTLNLTRGLYLTKIKFDAQKIKLNSPHEIPDPCNRIPINF